MRLSHSSLLLEEFTDSRSPIDDTNPITSVELKGGKIVVWYSVVWLEELRMFVLPTDAELRSFSKFPSLVSERFRRGNSGSSGTLVIYQTRKNWIEMYMLLWYDVIIEHLLHIYLRKVAEHYLVWVFYRVPFCLLCWFDCCSTYRVDFICMDRIEELLAFLVKCGDGHPCSCAIHYFEVKPVSENFCSRFFVSQFHWLGSYSNFNGPPVEEQIRRKIIKNLRLVQQ